MSEDIQKDLIGVDYSKLRKYKRFDVKIDCVLHDLKLKTIERSLLTTISVGGVSVLYPKLMNKSEVVHIEFTMPNESSVSKHIEVRWSNPKKVIVKFEGKSLSGYEHGCKFILAKKNTKPEKVINCDYHLEFYRERGGILKHGYVSKISVQHLHFNTLAELRMDEKLTVNMILNEDGLFAEKKMSIKVTEIKKNGKQFSVQGIKV